MSIMTDQQKWEKAVAAIAREYRELTPVVRKQADSLLERVTEAKTRVHAFAEHLQGGEICASCGGECCLTGKYHFTVVDLLCYLREGKELFLPRFASGRCPYLGDAGCFMEPRFRPYNCVTFNCDRVEGLMKPVEKERFMDAERELRACYRQMEELFGNRFLQGMLINCERDLIGHGVQVLRGTAVENSAPSGRRIENG